jgi:hypothetical protein
MTDLRPIMEVIREREEALETRIASAVAEFKRDVRAIEPNITEAGLNEMALRALAYGRSKP